MGILLVDLEVDDLTSLGPQFSHTSNEKDRNRQLLRELRDDHKPTNPVASTVGKAVPWIAMKITGGGKGLKINQTIHASQPTGPGSFTTSYVLTPLECRVSGGTEVAWY